MRNILYELFGLESCTFHQDPDRFLDPDYARYPIVKTHLLPNQLPSDLQQRKVVYLVRDGRDAYVSIAHHRADIVAPGSDYEHNLVEAILAMNGSFFGGWSQNVRQWHDRADIVIRYEDLIMHPMNEVSRLRDIMDLPSPTHGNIPTFHELKFGTPKYGGEHENRDVREKNFRRGIVGSYEEELPPYIEKLLLLHHQEMLLELGYVDSDEKIKESPKRVLLEASKFLDHHYDGISRYVSELIQHYPQLLRNQKSWIIDLQVGDCIYPLVGPNRTINPNEFRDQILEEKIGPEEYDYEKKLLNTKKKIRRIVPDPLYSVASRYYRSGPFRKALASIRQYKLRLDHTQSLPHQDPKSTIEYDLVHAPLPQNLISLSGKAPKSLVTIHDMTHISHPSFHEVANLEAASVGIDLSIQMKSAYIVISESTRQDLKQHIETGLIYNIPQGIHPQKFHPSVRKKRRQEIEQKYKLPSKFIFCLSTIEPRKNLITTIEAFCKLIHDVKFASWHLVIGGKPGWQYDQVLNHQEIPQIHFTGYIDDHDLPYVYGRASVFSYVSHYEGFGLPLIEAMGCGTPVVYGANSSMKEIVGDHGIGCNPNDSDAIKEAYIQLLSDTENGKSDVIKLHANAGKYTWLKTALKTLDVYEDLIEQSK